MILQDTLLNLDQKDNKLLLIVEGNIGAGKSTFLRLIGKFLQAQLVYEPHTRWQNINGENLLDHFYKDTQRWAYTFQSYAFLTRVIEQREHARINTKPLQVLERSVYSDRYIFAKNAHELGFMSTLEWNLYKEWFSWFIDNYAQSPSAFIYLQTDPEVCYRRLIKRNRLEENGVGLEYIKQLHEKHEQWLVHKEFVSPSIAKTPVLVLECNEDFEESIKLQEGHVQSIANFLFERFNLAPSQSLLNSPTTQSFIKSSF